jgi:hypothetical protein
MTEANSGPASSTVPGFTILPSVSEWTFRLLSREPSKKHFSTQEGPSSFHDETWNMNT